MTDFLLGSDPAGDYTNTGTYPGQFFLGALAFPWVAVATGTVTSIVLKTDGRTSTATDLELGLYSSLPGGDFADARLDYGAYGGTPPSSSDVEVSGLHADVVEGETYFIAVKAIGGRVYFAYDGAAGPTTYTNGSAGEASLSEDAVWHNGDGVVFDGPPGLAAYGVITGPAAPARTGFEVAITTHHDLETETPAHVVQWVRDRSAVELGLTKSGRRTGKVTISVYDGAAALFDSGANDYLYRLFIRLNGVPALWAPIETSWDAETKTVTMDAVDVDRMESHYVRDGDEAIDTASSFDGQLPVDHRGMRLLRDAANNTPEQDARFVVPLGIRDGTASTESAARVKVGRGDEVFGDMTQLAQGVNAPDISIDVLDVEDPTAYPDYMVLNCYDRQGTDRTAGGGAVVLQCGYGLQNLTGFKLTPAAFVTHAHVLGDGGHPRVTRFHALSSRQRGVYVRWIATQLKVDASDTTALEQIAEAIIKAYGLPLHAYAITMKPDSLQGKRLLRDFGIGDVVTAGVKEGYLNREIAARVMAATVKETGKVRDTITSLTVVPSLVNDEDIGGGEQ